MKKDLIIIGVGGLGREVLWQIQDNKEEIDKYNILGFVDDDPAVQDLIINGYPVLGTVAWLSEYHDQVSVVVAIASSRIKNIIVNKLVSNSNIEFPSIVSRNVTISPTSKFGRGCIFCLNSVISVNIEIGDFFLCDWNCTVGHDCKIDDYVTLYPSVNISGNVSIGMNTEIGTGTQIIQGKSVGEECIIGAGTVVISDTPSNCTAVGVPSKVIKCSKR